MLTELFRKIFPYPRTFYGYIWREVKSPFLGGLLFFIFVLLMFQLIKFSDFLVVHNVAPSMILRLISYLCLSFLPMVIPLSFLLAVLVGFGRLSSDSEVIAMRASGMSLLNLLTPVAAQGLIITLVSLSLNLYLVPWANHMFRYEFFRISNTKAIATIHEGVFTEGFFGMVLYAEKVDSKANRMEKVFIYDEKDPQNPVTIIAERGQIIGDQRDPKGVPGIILRLFNGGMHKSNPLKNVYELIDFATYDIFLRIETARVVGVEKPKTMDMSSIEERIDYLSARKENLSKVHLEELRKLTAEFWNRYALSFSCFIFSIMGVAFGVVRTRTVRSNSLMVCMLVFLGYWLMFKFATQWATDGILPAFVAMWLANLILMIISCTMFYRASR